MKCTDSTHERVPRKDGAGGATRCLTCKQAGDAKYARKHRRELKPDMDKDFYQWQHYSWGL